MPSLKLMDIPAIHASAKGIEELNVYPYSLQSEINYTQMMPAYPPRLKLRDELYLPDFRKTIFFEQIPLIQKKKTQEEMMRLLDDFTLKRRKTHVVLSPMNVMVNPSKSIPIIKQLPSLSTPILPVLMPEVPVVPILHHYLPFKQYLPDNSYIYERNSSLAKEKPVQSFDKTKQLLANTIEDDYKTHGVQVQRNFDKKRERGHSLKAISERHSNFTTLPDGQSLANDEKVNKHVQQLSLLHNFPSDEVRVLKPVTLKRAIGLGKSESDINNLIKDIYKAMRPENNETSEDIINIGDGRTFTHLDSVTHKNIAYATQENILKFLQNNHLPINNQESIQKEPLFNYEKLPGLKSQFANNLPIQQPENVSHLHYLHDHDNQSQTSQVQNEQNRSIVLYDLTELDREELEGLEAELLGKARMNTNIYPVPNKTNNTPKDSVNPNDHKVVKLKRSLGTDSDLTNGNNTTSDSDSTSNNDYKIEIIKKIITKETEKTKLVENSRKTDILGMQMLDPQLNDLDMSVLDKPELLETLKQQTEHMYDLVYRIQNQGLLRSDNSDFDKVLQNVAERRKRKKEAEKNKTPVTSTALPTVEMLIDEQMVREALRNDPYIKRILMLSKAKKDAYFGKPKRLKQLKGNYDNEI